MLSKEIGLVAIAAIVLAWAHWAIMQPTQRRRALGAIVLALLCAGIYFAWRAMVLGTPASGLTGALPLGSAIAKGLVDWLHQAPSYFSYWPRLGFVARALVIAALAPIIFFATWRQRDGWRGDLVPLLCGACLIVLPALLQAPVAALNAQPLGIGESSVEAAMQSRLYYFSIGGLAMLFAGGIADIWNTRIARNVLTVALAVCVAAFAWVSRETAVAYAVTTAASRPLAQAVAAAVDRAAPAGGARCRIVVLGVQPPPEWSIYVSTDSIAKALTSDVDRVGRCVIESDAVTYFNLMRGDANPADASPYTPRTANGRPIPWLRVGDMTAAYLDPPANAEPTALAGIAFLRYENGAFTDVTVDVASGRVPVALR
jgi:hypothetical protein